MKKKLLGLGVCALALGVVAGAVSARSAIVADATANKLTVYIDSEAWKDDKAFAIWAWGGTAGEGAWYSPNAKVDSNLYRFSLDDDFEAFHFVGFNKEAAPNWENKAHESGNITFEANKDKYTISSTSWGVADSYALRMVGKFNGKQTSWDFASSIASGDLADNNQYQKVGLGLAAGDEFKITYVNLTSSTVTWASEFKFSDIIGGTGSSNFEEGKDNEENPNGNIKVKEGKGSTYDIYLQAGGTLWINDQNYVPDVPAADGYYLCGNESFSGSGKDWKYSGAKKMSTPESGTDLAELRSVQMKVGDSVRARSYLTETDTWLNHGGEDYTFADLDGENYVFTKAGLYNFFVNSEGKLYIAGTGAGPIAEDGFIWLSTGNYGDGYDLYLYTWSGTGNDKVEGLGAFPGTLVSEIDDADVSDCLNFNNAGGIWKVPATVLLDNFIVTAKKGESVHQTCDLESAKNIYANVSDEDQAETSTSIAKEALVAFEIASAVNSATNKSVCAVNSATANTIVGHYDALNNDHDRVDAATLWTHAGSKIAQSDEDRDNIRLSAIVLQLRAIAEKQNQAIMWNGSTLQSTNTALVITLVALGGAAVLGMGVYFASRKRKSK